MVVFVLIYLTAATIEKVTIEAVAAATVVNDGMNLTLVVMPIVAAVVAVVVYFVKNYYSYFFSYDCYLLMKMIVTVRKIVRKIEIEIEIVEVMRTAMVKKNLLQDHQMWVAAAVAAVIVYY